jgi:hypothetical protein
MAKHIHETRAVYRDSIDRSATRPGCSCPPLGIALMKMVVRRAPRNQRDKKATGSTGRFLR